MQLSANSSFLVYCVVYEKWFYRCLSPWLESRICGVDECSVGLPRRLCGPVKVHSLVLEEKSLVSERACDNLGV